MANSGITLCKLMKCDIQSVKAGVLLPAAKPGAFLQGLKIGLRPRCRSIVGTTKPFQNTWSHDTEGKCRPRGITFITTCFLFRRNQKICSQSRSQKCVEKGWGRFLPGGSSTKFHTPSALKKGVLRITEQKEHVQNRELSHLLQGLDTYYKITARHRKAFFRAVFLIFFSPEK